MGGVAGGVGCGGAGWGGGCGGWGCEEDVAVGGIGSAHGGSVYRGGGGDWRVLRLGFDAVRSIVELVRGMKKLLWVCNHGSGIQGSMLVMP